MFKTFLKSHALENYDFSQKIYPPIGDRAFWDAFPKESCLPEAEKLLDYGWEPIKATDWMAFKRTGDRIIMENIHFERRRALTRLAFAELCENKGRFLPQIVNGLFVICEESYWGLSAHWWAEVGFLPSPQYPYIDLFAAETAEHLTAISYMLCKPLRDFCPDILDRIEYELERRIRVPYMTHMDFWWMGYQKKRVNNWNPWILSNVLTVFLLTEHNPKRLREALKKILSELQHYYDSIPADGGCDEGPHYWGKAGGALFEALYQLKLASGGDVDLFDDDKIRNIASYLKKVHLTDDFFANFADAHAVGLGDDIWLVYAFARETHQESLMNFAAAVYQDAGAPSYSPWRNLRFSIFNYLALQEMTRYPVRRPLHGPLELLPDIEVAALREGNWCICAKGGHNHESHNHNDVGSFVLYDGNTPVLVDPGIGVYTKFTFGPYRYDYIPWVHSDRHNLPLINGVRQKYGDEFRTSSFAAQKGEVTVSFAAAYPAESGLRTLCRHLSLDRNGLRICDRMAFVGQEQRVTEYFMTVLPVTIADGAAMLGGRYRLTASTGSFRTEFISFEEDACLERDWNVKGLTRIALDTENAEEICISVEKIK